MNTTAFILVACCVFGFGLVSRRLADSPLTPPLAFVGLGIVLGPWGLGWLDLNVEQGVMHVLAELTLILVLFGASKIPQLARGLGKGITEFKKGLKEVDTDESMDEIGEDTKKDDNQA